jgi:hypothetical protein
MAAGLGFKDFVTGEVLTAADVDGYLMQNIWVFASAAARDAAVTSPQEGNFAYLKDTNVTTYYTGSAWANLDTTGMTNPMTTTGDTIYSSSGSTPARLGIGSTGQVLTVAAGIPSWASPAGGGGMTLINSGGTTLSGATTSISSIPTTYKNLQLIIRNFKPATDGQDLLMRLNGITTNNIEYHLNNRTNNVSFGSPFVKLVEAVDNTTAEGLIQMNFYDYANTTAWKNGWGLCTNNNSTTATNFNYQMTGWCSNQTAAITELTFFCGSGNMTSGTAYLYGVS